MSSFVCRLVDDSGKTAGEVPLVVSSQNDAISMARATLKLHPDAAGFELWNLSRCVLHEKREKVPADDPHGGSVKPS